MDIKDLQNCYNKIKKDIENDKKEHVLLDMGLLLENAIKVYLNDKEKQDFSGYTLHELLINLKLSNEFEKSLLDDMFEIKYARNEESHELAGNRRFRYFSPENLSIAFDSLTKMLSSLWSGFDNKVNIKQSELYELIDKCWDNFVRNRNRTFVVNPSIPILWFGNYEKYKQSKKKIITIALNPSNKEFERTYTGDFQRFRNGHNLSVKNNLSEQDKENLINDYNNYFETKPYIKWFDWFDKALKPLGASYYARNNLDTALHIDYYSTLATNPTWSKLNKEEKEMIEDDGLCADLFNYFNPDIVLFSGAFDNFIKMFRLWKESPVFEAKYNNTNFKIVVYKKDGKKYVFGSNVMSNPFQFNEKEFTIPQMDKISRI